MADRTRGRGGGGRGTGGRGRGSGGRGRGRGGSARGGSSAGGSAPKQILDLGKYIDKKLIVKFNGGRQVVGVLKGWDPLMNLVLDECQECERDAENQFKIIPNKMRNVGLVVCRGTAVFLVCPVDGTEEIENPFLEQE